MSLCHYMAPTHQFGNEISQQYNGLTNQTAALLRQGLEFPHQPWTATSFTWRFRDKRIIWMVSSILVKFRVRCFSDVYKETKQHINLRKYGSISLTSYPPKKKTKLIYNNKNHPPNVSLPSPNKNPLKATTSLGFGCVWPLNFYPFHFASPRESRSADFQVTALVKSIRRVLNLDRKAMETETPLRNKGFSQGPL